MKTGIVALADDWSTTDRWQVNGLEADGASVHTVDIRNRAAVEELLAAVRPDRVAMGPWARPAPTRGAGSKRSGWLAPRPRSGCARCSARTPACSRPRS